MPNHPSGVKRVVYKEIVEGDFRKFRAESNDSDTGGGARDLRFRPYATFENAFRKMFPQVRQEQRKRNGSRVTTDVLVGRFYWKDSAGNERSKEALFEPPTDARPDEGRLPVVHTYPPLNLLPPINEGRIVLLLVQRDDDSVWPHFATENSLRSGAWHNDVALPILTCLDTRRRSNAVARGYIDFETETRFCDA